MGPPLSPREPRRSGRRSAPFASRSPDSEPIPRQKDFPLRPALISTNSNSKNKRPKQEEQDDPQEDRKIPIPHSASSANGSSNGRSKRKTKDRDKHLPVLDNVPDTSTPHPEDVAADVLEEEEQGITRCVCGSTGAYIPFLFSIRLTVSPPRRGRPGCWRVHGSVRDVQSLAAWAMYGLPIRGSSPRRRLLLRTMPP